MSDEALIHELLSQYVYQKEKLIEVAGGKARLNHSRLCSLMRPRIEKMADVVRDWDVKPSVIMEAVFDRARRHNHPGGPMPNMLFSVKYITSALSDYLQVPYEVVMEKRSISAFLERMDWEFNRFRGELERAGVTDLVTATSFPVEVRYLMAVMNLDWDSAFFLAQDLLETMNRDKRVSLWMAHRGVRYEVVAQKFNKRKKLYDRSKTL
jgi:hypothetical protein